MSAEYARYKEGGQLAVVGTPSPAPVSTGSSTSGGGGGWAWVGVFLVAVVGWVLWRRRKRDAGLASELKAALQGPEGVLTDVYLTIDGLENHPRFVQLLEAANACQAKLDALKQGQPSREAIAKARALNDEANRVRRQFDEARMVR
jgi:MYXO-CTERM domain-containing protein